LARRRRREEEPPPAGAPAWMVTYGDMMTLLMTFFVLIVSFSEIKVERVMEALASFRAYLGGRFEEMVAPPGDLPSTRPEILPRPSEGGEKVASVESFESIRGPNVRVESISEGIRITIGGKILFDEGSAELKPGAEEKLVQVAAIVKGYRNKINITGHASTFPLPADSSYPDHMGLSLARARAVENFMTERGGIRKERIRVMGASTYENTASNLHPEGRSQNNRVELMLTTEFIGTGG